MWRERRRYDKVEHGTKKMERNFYSGGVGEKVRLVGGGKFNYFRNNMG